MNVIGLTRRSRMHTIGQTLLWSSLALGAGIWFMKEHGIQTPFCGCSGSDGNNDSQCGCH